MPTPPTPFPWLRLRPLVPRPARWLYLQTIATQAARAPWIEALRLEAHTRWCDLGIGLGALAFEGLYRYPQALCTGLDRDPDMLSFLAGAAGVTGLQGRLTLVEGDAEHPALTGPFDLVTARFLLQHVANPRRVIRSAARLTAPGGRFLAIDVDDGATLTDPDPTPEARAVMEALKSAQAVDGGGRERGRRLAGMMMDAGFEVHVTAITRAHVYTSQSERETSYQVEESRLLEMAPRLRAQLQVDERAWGELLAAYRQWNLSLRFAMVTEIGVEGRRMAPPVRGGENVATAADGQEGDSSAGNLAL